MALSKINLQSSEAIASLNEERPLLSRRARPVRLPDIQRSFLSGVSGDTELFEKASNINGFQGGRVANNLYISPFRATVFKTAALFLYLNSSVVIRVRKPLLFPLRPP